MHDSHDFLADPKRLPINCRRRWRAICAALLIVIPASVALAEGNITLVRVPDGGIQPQITTHDHGTLHLLYFKGARIRRGSLLCSPIAWGTGF